MQDLTGEKFGRWEVVADAGVKDSYRYWICKCDCGTIREVTQSSLLSRKSSSCGCMRKEQRTKHNCCRERLFSVWDGMIRRCANSKHRAYKNYGDRGITICEEWLDPINFLNWANELWEEGLQLDRRDNEKGYYPENCRFVTAEVNVHNSRNRYSKTGLRGIDLTASGRYKARVSSIRLSDGRVDLGTFATKEEAVIARNNFIIEHKLPHKIQVIEL